MLNIDLKNAAKTIAANTFLIFDETLSGHEAFDLFLDNPKSCEGVAIDEPYKSISPFDVATEMQDLFEDVFSTFARLYRNKLSIH